MLSRCARREARSRRTPGQSIAEFAIVFPLMMLILGAIIQFGVIFWGQNTLTQIARDTGRWASTQNGCTTGIVDVLNTAKAIAASSSLVGPSSGWNASNVQAVWTGTPCPPLDNTDVAWVRITINHQVPVFFPWIPGNGNLSTIAEFRMEPQP